MGAGGGEGGCIILRFNYTKSKAWLFSETEIVNSKHVNSEYAIYGLVGTHKKQVMFLLIYVTSTPAIFFNFQVKRDGRESNRATNLSPPPRLKMTDIKHNQQTTEKSKVYTILSPFPPPHPTPPQKKEKI